MFRNFPSAIRTYLIRASARSPSGDSRFMFVIYDSDLIVKVWFVYMVLALDFLGFS